MIKKLKKIVKRVFKMKDKTKWYCEFGIVNGEERQPEIIWNDGEEPGPFFNSIGSPYNYSCKKIN